MKKRIIAFIMAIFVVLGLCGCQGTGKDKDDKVEITMYLWDKTMSKQLTPWLEKQFPEIKFTFVVGYNTMAYYTDLTSRGAEMPDIITCRRFSINDAAHLSDKLMDLSQTEIVGTFYSNYIENNREMDGAIRWLPGCAEIDSYVANLDLFEKYDIPIPTNYDEFVRAVDAFEAVGIKGFDTDWNADYTSLEIMQGCAIPELMSLEGTMWRRAYESEKEDGQVGLDDVVWPTVFEKFRQYIKDVKAAPEDHEREWNPVIAEFKNGETAIIRATANDCKTLNTLSGMNCAMLPYYGETSNDNWVLTYPICQVAVAKHVEKDSAKKEAVIKVLKAIFSEEGQAALAANASVLSYNKIVNMDLNDNLRYIKDCIESNQMYIRLASTEFFTVSRYVAKNGSRRIFITAGLRGI